MSDIDPFEQNISGVANLVGADINKTKVNPSGSEVGEPVDILELKMSDERLLDLARVWQGLHDLL